MKSHSKSHLVLVGAVALGTLVVMTASPASADARESDGHSADRGYNAIPDKVHGNVPSVAFEATATNEFGDEVGLGGKARTLDSMSVVMSSWGCSESGAWHTTDCVTDHKAMFDVPLTLTIYADIDSIRGDVLATRTKTVAVQYRPSASPKCTDNNVPNGKWYSKKDHTFEDRGRPVSRDRLGRKVLGVTALRVAVPRRPTDLQGNLRRVLLANGGWVVDRHGADLGHQLGCT